MTQKEIDSIKKELIDSSNRSRKNNIVLYNVPEGEESEIGCAEYVTKFLKEIIGMVPDIEVAPRSGKDISKKRMNIEHRVQVTPEESMLDVSDVQIGIQF